MPLIRILALVLLFVGGPALAITGPEVAQLLNSRYQNTATQCVGNNPAYFCSGVLVRASQGVDEFWKHGAVSAQSGAEGFAYLRADLDTRGLTQANGVIFTDQFTAIGQGKTLDVLCAYPFEMTLAGNRPDHGCGLSAATVATQDVSSCAALGIGDAPGWLAHFQQQDQQPERQCSLSSRDPAQFKASLVAHQLIDDTWSAKPNLLLVRNWDAQAPKQMPLHGLFYDSTKTGALLGAQKDQRDYFNATGDWLPILRMDLTQAPDAVFGFNQQDQLYIGYQVASRLNARYADTAMACPGDTPAYNCNGVLIRTTDASSAFHAWNPSDGSISRNGVSFSYMRTDVYLSRLAWAKNQGLIMKELAAPTGYPLKVRCAYPYDGATFYRSSSCNEHTGAPQVSTPCADQGITTEQQWLAHFNALASKFTSCSFTGETLPFAVSLKARALLDIAVQRGQHNELIIANWPQNIGEQLPLEAFFYVAEVAKPNAVFFQRDYFQQTGRYLPIMQVDLAATDGKVFTFDPQDLVLPKPKILKAAHNGEGPELDLNQVTGGARLNIDGWPHMAIDQYVWLRLKGEKTDGSQHDYQVWVAPSRVTPVEYDRGYLYTDIPYSYLQALRDGSTLTVEFKVAFTSSTDENLAFPFPLRTYTVNGQVVPLAPSVKEADGTTLNPINATDSLNIVVPADIALLPDDKLKVTWTGAPGTPAGGSYTSGESLVSAGLEIPIPNRVVAFNLGKSVKVSYEVIRGNEDPIPSPELSLAVQPIAQADLQVAKPKILQAANGGEGSELDMNTLTGNATVRIDSWPHIATGQYVWLRLTGTKTDGSAYERTLWGQANGSRVSEQWVLAGFATNTALIGELRELRDGSTLTVEFKVTFDQSTAEAEAVTFPSRSYTVRGQRLQDHYTSFEGGNTHGWYAGQLFEVVHEAGNDFGRLGSGPGGSGAAGIARLQLPLQPGVRYEISFVGRTPSGANPLVFASNYSAGETMLYFNLSSDWAPYSKDFTFSQLPDYVLFSSGYSQGGIVDLDNIRIRQP